MPWAIMVLLGISVILIASSGSKYRIELDGDTFLGPCGNDVDHSVNNWYDLSQLSITITDEGETINQGLVKGNPNSGIKDGDIIKLKGTAYKIDQNGNKRKIGSVTRTDFCNVFFKESEVWFQATKHLIQTNVDSGSCPPTPQTKQTVEKYSSKEWDIDVWDPYLDGLYHTESTLSLERDPSNYICIVIDAELIKTN